MASSFIGRFDGAALTGTVPTGFNSGAEVDLTVTELMYQVHDGPISDITAVYSNGLLLDPIYYTKFLDEGKFLIDIGSVSGATITADVVGAVYSAAPSTYPGTAQEIIREIVQNVPGLAAEDIDLTKFDDLVTPYFEGVSTIWDATAGIYLPEGGSTVSVLNLFSNTFGAYMGFNRAGVFDIGVFTPPDNAASVVSITDEYITKIERLPVAVPNYEHALGYAKNYTVMSEDSIAPEVVENDPDRYAFLSQEYRNATATNSERGIRKSDAVVEAVPPGSGALYWTMQDRYPSSKIKDSIDSVILNQADALLEIRRKWHLYNNEPYLVQRDRLSITLEVQPFELQLNDTIHVTYSRFGLDAGKYFRIISLAEDSLSNEMVLEVWG